MFIIIYYIKTIHDVSSIQKRFELDIKAGRKANMLSWVGLGLMSVQFGVLARLTWFEYSWDVSFNPSAIYYYIVHAISH